MFVYLGILKEKRFIFRIVPLFLKCSTGYGGQTDSNPVGPSSILGWSAISQDGLETVPAGSHKPNDGGSNPSPATINTGIGAITSIFDRTLTLWNRQRLRSLNSAVE